MRVIAQRYAAALVDVSLEGKNGEKTGKDLGDFTQLFRDSADLRNFLSSPSIPRASKHDLIEKLVARLGGSEPLRNLLFVVADNQRMQLLPEIHQEFVRQLHDRLGIAQASVSSAQELTAQQEAHLRRALEHLTGKKIEARYHLDPGLIAGAVVRIGSTVYDGSVRGQLEQMRQRMAGE